MGQSETDEKLEEVSKRKSTGNNANIDNESKAIIITYIEDNRLKDSKVISETGVLCDTRNDPKVNEPRAMRKVAVNETNGHRTNAT